MNPLRLHAPAGIAPTRASEIVFGAPPLTRMVLSWSSAKNPMDWLSGDQKGPLAPSVPGSGRHGGLATTRIHSAGTPWDSATAVMSWPSGEISKLGVGGRSPRPAPRYQ